MHSWNNTFTHETKRVSGPRVGDSRAGLLFWEAILRTADVSPCSSPLGDVSQGGTSATQRQKFHTDDLNQCLHNKFGSHWVPNANLFNFTFPPVDFGKVLCSSANAFQQNSNVSSREDYIPQISAVLVESHRVYNWPLCPFVFCLSFVNNS